LIKSLADTASEEFERGSNGGGALSVVIRRQEESEAFEIVGTEEAEAPVAKL
jgi:hypothetical protein